MCQDTMDTCTKDALIFFLFLTSHTIAIFKTLCFDDAPDPLTSFPEELFCVPWETSELLLSLLPSINIREGRWLSQYDAPEEVEAVQPGLSFLEFDIKGKYCTNKALFTSRCPRVPLLSFPQATMLHGKLKTFLLMAGYFAYLLGGAWVFQVLESDTEMKQKAAVLRMKEDFLSNFTSLSPGEVETFMTNMMEAVRMGTDPTGHNHSNWDFSNSFFFVGSMLSTIGYGNLSPKTTGGQLFCVVFALFGIPLNIVFLHHIGKVLSLLCERLANCLNRKGVEKKTMRFLTLLFFLVMGILVFLCVPSIVFQVMEDWTYGEAIYFAFITLSTIGFGDYVIGRQRSKKYFHYYRVLVAIWIIFGLAWIALLFNLLTNLLEDPDMKPAKGFLPVKTGTRKKRKSKSCPSS